MATNSETMKFANKFNKIRQGKHRNHTIDKMGPSTAYVVIHTIDTDKVLTPEEKVELIIAFCQTEITVDQIAEKMNVAYSRSVNQFWN